MFGYVTVYKPELKIKEYEAYKGVYCTLCKSMGKEYGLLSRFLLSYDGAFYVMYKMGLSKGNIDVRQSRCSFNPCKKCMKVTCDSDIYSIAATITVLLAYFKLVDNIHDSKLFKRILLYIIYPYFVILKNKARKKHPDIFEKIQSGMERQFEIEKDENVSLDKSADSTAKMLGWLFAYGECDKNSSFAYDFGYHLGRVVYFLDAFDDYEKDIADGTFNPFAGTENIIDNASVCVKLSVGTLTEVLEEQEFSNFKSIIENVIFDGIDFQLERIIKKHRGENK